MTVTLAHLAVTWFMVGLIWTIQVVHYPLFASVGTDTFPAYERRHTVRMGWLLAAPATVEVALALWLVVLPPAGIELWATWLGGAILAAIWVATLLVQVPLHRRLAAGADRRLIGRLVRSNAARTAAWTGRGVLAAVFLV